MNRIAKDRCGYSRYICKGIPRLTSDGMYKGLTTSADQVTSLNSCAIFTGTESADTYIWHNFGNIPTTIRIYDDLAQAVQTLSVVTSGLLLDTCNVRYDRYSPLYFSVAATVGAQIHTILLRRCYILNGLRILHTPGLLDPAHVTPDSWPPLPQRLNLGEPLEASMDLRALQMGHISGGRFANALQLSQLRNCSGFAVNYALHEYKLVADDDLLTCTFTYHIKVSGGEVRIIADVTKALLLWVQIKPYTALGGLDYYLVSIALGQSVTVYVYCLVINTPQTDLGWDYYYDQFLGRLILSTTLLERYPGSSNTVNIPIATLTIGCSSRLALKMLFTAVDAGGATSNAQTTQAGGISGSIDDALSRLYVDTGWTLQAFELWQNLIATEFTGDIGRCAVSVLQHTCSPAQILRSLFLSQALSIHLLDGDTTIAVQSTWGAPTRTLQIGPFNYYSSSSREAGIVQLLQILGLPDSPTEGQPLRITNVGLLPDGVLTVTGGVISSKPSGFALPLPDNPDLLYVLGYINGLLKWLKLVPGDAPTFPD